MSIDYEFLRNELKSKGTDLETLADGMGKPIENKIKPLLIVLNYLGYRTSASCEGHTLEEQKKRTGSDDVLIIDEDAYHYILEKKFGQAKGKIFVSQAPFVDLSITSEQFQRLDSVIHDYNSHKILSKAIPWGFLKIEDQFRLSPEYTHTLDELQAAINSVAEYIFVKHH